MKNFQRELRYLNSVVAFEAAGRHGNFTNAARELCITRVAVSRRIKSLEDDLGVRLFVRLHRGVVLTEEGNKLFEVSSVSLKSIAEVQSQLRSRSEKTHISVTMTMALSTYWMVPRLGRFRQQFPEIDVRLVVSDRYLGLEEEGIDLALRWYSLDENKDEGQKDILFPGAVIPVCSPEYAKRFEQVNKPSDLIGANLIYLEGGYLPDTTWDSWFRHFGLKPPEKTKCIFVDSYTSMVQAAIAGQGFALGDIPLLNPLRKDKSLSSPSNIDPVDTGLFRIIRSSQSADSTAVQNFCRWLEQESSN
jgi:LysR family glycine cleavage system transcriptional activator